MSRVGIIGFRIRASPTRPDPELIDRFRNLASSNVADAMGRFNFMDPAIRARTDRPICGPVVTVRCRPADNLMLHKALEVASPGDVLVVDTCGNQTSAVFGGLMCRSAAAAHLGGIVVDGAIRDLDDLAEIGFPAFSRTVSPGGCDKDGPGEINVPISCGGVPVMAGDIILGDRDGLVVIPRAEAEEVAALTTALMAREAARIDEIARGTVFKPDINEALRHKGIIA